MGGVQCPVHVIDNSELLVETWIICIKPDGLGLGPQGKCDEKMKIKKPKNENI